MSVFRHGQKKNGQDDIIWHAAQKIDAGTWSQEVNIANYNYAQGMYNVHAYVYYTDGTYECVGTQKVDMHLKYNTQMKINVDSYQSKMTVILSGQFSAVTHQAGLFFRYGRSLMDKMILYGILQIRKTVRLILRL